MVAGDGIGAHRADRGAWRRARRPQPCKLVTNPALRHLVEEKLTIPWPLVTSADLGLVRRHLP